LSIHFRNACDPKEGWFPLEIVREQNLIRTARRGFNVESLIHKKAGHFFGLLQKKPQSFRSAVLEYFGDYV